MTKVLVADDDQLLLRYLSLHLSASGYLVSEATSGNETIELIKQNPPDILILDSMMPHGNGTSVVEFIRSSASLQDLPIIMLTARKSGDDKISAFEAGVDDYIVKPFHFGELKSRIARIVSRSKVKWSA